MILATEEVSGFGYHGRVPPSNFSLFLAGNVARCSPSTPTERQIEQVFQFLIKGNESESYKKKSVLLLVTPRSRCLGFQLLG